MKFLRNNQTKQGRPRAAFTLIELMIVVGVILLLTAIIVPSVAKMFNSGADSQAHNLLTAQLAAARAVAVRNGTYAGVHVQMQRAPGTDDKATTGICFMGIVTYDAVSKKFVLANGYAPRRVPGSYAFGEVTASYVNSAKNPEEFNAISDADMMGFTTFTIVFNSSGAVVKLVDGNNVSFNTGEAAFTNGPNSPQLWSLPPDEPGVLAVTMFDYIQLTGRPDPTLPGNSTARADYLNDVGAYFPINVYTGQPFPRR
jgi:Tfp pilus assembly protein FimT